MQLATHLYVIGREDNVVLVDFSKPRSSPPPRFPGAAGLWTLGSNELTSDPFELCVPVSVARL